MIGLENITRVSNVHATHWVVPNTDLAASVLKEVESNATHTVKKINKNEWKLQKCYHLNKSLRKVSFIS